MDFYEQTQFFANVSVGTPSGLKVRPPAPWRGKDWVGEERERKRERERRLPPHKQWLRERGAATSSAPSQPSILNSQPPIQVPVDFYEQTQFFVNVSVGTPRQTRTVILDTGPLGLWVKGGRQRETRG